jgi:hypothetical protein
MYNFIEKMATEHLSVDATKLSAPVSNLKESAIGETIQKDFCELEPYIETGLNFGISAIGNPIAKWVLQIALVIVKALNTNFCPVKS